MEMNNTDKNNQTIKLKNGHMIFIEQINENQYIYRTGLLEPRVRNLACIYEDNDITRKYPPEKLQDVYPRLSPVSKPVVYSKEEIQEIVSLAQKIDENGKFSVENNNEKKTYTADDLEFIPHWKEPMKVNDEEYARLQFDNGFSVSVIKKDPKEKEYPEDDDYEVAVLDKDGKVCTTTDITSDVLSVKDTNELNKVMKDIQSLDENGKLPKKEHQSEHQYSSDERINEIFKRVHNALKKSSKSTNTTNLDKLVSVNQEKITAMFNKYAKKGSKQL